jgi:hypothetical protein
MATSVIFTMGCTKGHRFPMLEDEARELIATACPVCNRPLTVRQVRVQSVQAQPKFEPQLCPHHSNGDSICRRQKAGA